MPKGPRTYGAGPAEAALAATVQRLRAELDGVRRSQRSRAVIEQAKGLLAGRLDCTPDEAFDHLTRMSHQTHLKVAEVAAGLVGTTAPVFGPAPEPHDGAGFRPETYLSRPPGSPPDMDGAAVSIVPLPEETTARYHLTCSAMSAAQDCAALAEAFWADGLRHLGVSAVLLGVLEPDGAVRLVGTHGLPRTLVSAWQRVPSSLNVAFLKAVAGGRPLWVSAAEAAEAGYQLFGDGEMRACLPLRRRGRIFGVASVLWPDAVTPDATTRAYVTALADACGRRMSQLLGGAEAESSVASPAAHWVEAVLEALPGAFALLTPIRDGTGRITDWRFDCCSPQARDASGRTAGQIVGHRLLDLYPNAASTGILSGYENTLRTGATFVHGPAEVVVLSHPHPVTVTMSVQASRFGDGVLAHWHYHDEERRLTSRLDRLERVGDAGWAEWDFLSGDIRWSPSTYDILQRDPSRGPVKLGALHRYIDSADAPALTAAVQALTRERRPVDVELTVRRNGRTDRIRFVADPVVDRLGRLAGVDAAVRRLAEKATDAHEAAGEGVPEASAPMATRNSSPLNSA